MSLWNQIIKPIAVLCVICVVVTGALAVTNSMTDPIIKQASAEAANAARYELFPEATGFTRAAYSGEGVAEVYLVDGGGGMIVTASSKGYGGSVVVMVAFEPDGIIRQVKIQEQSETVGLGTRIEDKDFWGQYSGLTARPLELGGEISAISGATISSRAVNNGVNAAVAAFDALS